MNETNTGVPGNKKSRNELFDDWGAWLVVFGLALEIALAIFADDLKPSYERWGTVFATTVIAIGVWMEIHFGGIVRAEANARAAEAEAHLVDAKVELERLKALNAPRTLTRANAINCKS